MRRLRFTIEIRAARKKVWNTLWDEDTFRDWGGIIDEGQYRVGTMKEGNEVQFVSSVSGYGVTSLIERLVPGEFVSFRQMADTRESGLHERENEWTGGEESYSLTDKDGLTTLAVELDVPIGQEDTFKVRFPKALERVKALAETSQNAE